MTPARQASVMMHEVRHFDGHRHVTCTQGNEKGNRGACDNTITGKGSYAISVQTLVGMARSDKTEMAEKPGLEAEAIYMAFNKFNVVPKVKINRSIILSNTQSEVIEWQIGGQTKLLTTLPEPGVVEKSGPNFTIYPLDRQLDAYRKDGTFTTVIENPGLYAKLYNDDIPAEREKYKSISYGGTGGILKGNTLITLCDYNDLELGEDVLDDKGTFTTIIRMSEDPADQITQSLIISDAGEMYRFKCVDRESTDVEFELTDMKLADLDVKILNSFGLGGEQYALLEDGSLATLSVNSNTLSVLPLDMPMPNGDWVSATPTMKAEIFN